MWHGTLLLVSVLKLGAWEGLSLIEKTLALIVGGGGAYGVLYKPASWVFNKLPFMKRIAFLEQQSVRTARMEGSLDEILRELKPNGGSSMRDAQDAMADNVVKLLARTKLNESVLPFATFSTDENGRFGSVNPVFCEWCGRNESDLLGANWINAVHSEDQNFCKTKLTEAILDQRDLEITFRFQHKDGIFFKVKCIAKPIFNNRKLVSYLGSIKKL